MVNSSANFPNSSVPASPNTTKSVARNPILRAIQGFWRFSKFYGEFMSIPIRERKIRH